MNLLHLKYIIEVEKYGSISKASTSLCMNQPHLSKIIREFENNMHFKIFERTSKGVVPTKKGREFINKAKGIVKEVDILTNQYQQVDQTVNIDLSVPRASYISEGFVRYLKQSDILKKSIHINYHETNSKETINNVFIGEYEVGIIRYPINDESYYLNQLEFHDLDYKPLLEFDYKVLMSKNNVLANKKIYFEDLLEQIELIHGDISLPELPLSITNELPTKLRSNKVINIYERASEFEILQAIDNTYMWVSSMPKNILKRHNLIVKECLDKNITCKDIVIYRKGMTLSQEYLELLKTIQETI